MVSCKYLNINTSLNKTSNKGPLILGASVYQQVTKHHSLEQSGIKSSESLEVGKVRELVRSGSW